MQYSSREVCNVLWHHSETKRTPSGENIIILPSSRVESPQLRDRIPPSRDGRLELVLHVPHLLRGVHHDPRDAQGHHRGPFLPDDRAAEPEREPAREHRVGQRDAPLLQNPELLQRLLAVAAVPRVPLVPLQTLRDRLHLGRVVPDALRPAHAAAGVVVHPLPEPGHAGVRRRRQIIRLLPALLPALHRDFDAVHGLNVLIPERVRRVAVHAVVQTHAHERGIFHHELHVPPKRVLRRRGEQRVDAVARGDLLPARALHRPSRVRLELGEHEAPPGLRGRVQNRRGEVPVPARVLVFAPRRARRGEEPLGADVLIPRVVPAVLNDEPDLVHAALFHVEPRHRLELHVHRLAQPTRDLVVLGVQPLRVRRVELVLERGRVAHGEFNHAPVAGEVAKLRRLGRDRDRARLEPRVRAGGGPHPQHAALLFDGVGDGAAARGRARGALRLGVD
eukprot:31122-Pelagococcus_subviridis.AAC.12